MTGGAHVLRAAMQGRLEAAGIAIASDVLDGCLTYLELLARWNARMNLTALPLSSPIPSQSIDKLVVEPLCAVDLLSVDPAIVAGARWLDLGSGGGSPAIPLRLALRSGALSMVESRARKCAFLREVVRTLGLERTHVQAQRFEELGSGGSIDLITLRAVRVDADLVGRFREWLVPGGTVLCFGGAFEAPGFLAISRLPLPDGSELTQFRLE